MNLSQSPFSNNNGHVTTHQQVTNGSDEITSSDILELLATMNGERGYAESIDAWSTWDALAKSADAATRGRMLEACRQFAISRASALRNGAA